MINQSELDLLRDALATLDEGYSALPEFGQDVDVDAISQSFSW